MYLCSMMKQLSILLLLVGVMACSTLTPAERAAKEARQAALVKKALDDRHYVIDIQMMYPQRGPAKNVTGDYSLEVRGDSLLSYLPYFGRAYLVPYGGGKGLNFTGIIEKYSASRNAKGAYEIAIGLSNEEDTYYYMLEIFDNGNATIDVTAKQREPISYSGQMDIGE